MQNRNFILRADSYKLSHGPVLPAGTDGYYSYGEARVPDLEQFVVAGVKRYIVQYLSKPLRQQDVMEAEDFANAHGEPFDRGLWNAVVSKNQGYIPVKISAMLEGSIVRGSTPVYAVEAEGNFASLASYIETELQRAVWYPSTIATLGLQAKRIIRRHLAQTGGDVNAANFMLHDFGARGVSSEESAQIGGGAHLMNFYGTDTMTAARDIMELYGDDMPGFSVPATEHSIQCAYGNEGQDRYLRAVLDRYLIKDRIVSIVLDGYDIYRDTQLLCDKFGDEIMASGAKVVIRPDSGDPIEVLPKVFRILARKFGYDTTSTGHKQLRRVGILQGDGIDNRAIDEILGAMAWKGMAAGNFVFGSGGGLLQKVNRDTFKFAQKGSAVRINGQWVDIYKDPVTDPGKRSKAGRVTPEGGFEYVAYDNGVINTGANGSFADVRARVALGL